MGDKNPKKQMKKAAAPKKVAAMPEIMAVKPGQKAAPKPAAAKKK